LNTVIEKAGQTGLLCQSGNASCKNIDISGCEVCGAGVTHGSRLVVEESVLHDNGKFGVQMTDAGSTLFLTKSTLMNHLNGMAMIVAGGAIAKCSGCTFKLSKQPHIEVREGASLFLDQCQTSESQSGIGVQVHKQGVIEANASRIGGESQFGIFVGDQGILRASQTAVTECRIGGILTLPNSNSEITECWIEGNTDLGIQITGGVFVAKRCVIQKHGKCGVFVASGAEFTEEGNQYTANEGNDVVRE
jgi:hypothetical protein